MRLYNRCQQSICIKEFHGAVTRDRNIATWLGDAPQPVRDTTNQLLERIAFACRADYLPAQDDILNALAYTPADQVKVVILGQDPYHGPTRPWGCRSRSPRRKPSCRRACATSIRNSTPIWLPHPRHGRPNPLGTTGRPAPQHHAHRARACRQLARQTGLEHAHRLRYRTLLPAAPTGSLFGMGPLCPADGRRQARRYRRGQGNRQVPPGLYAPLAAFGQPCHAELPAFMGSRPFSTANRLLEQHGSTPVNWTCLD